MYVHAVPLGLLSLLALPVMQLVTGGEDDDEEVEPHVRDLQVGWLRSIGDRDALFQILQTHDQLTQGLDAAQALAELGDVRGLDHLIRVLDSPSSHLRQEATRMLKELNHPRGLRALQKRALEDLPPSADASRSDLYEDLNYLNTDELVAMWHAREPARMPASTLDVLEEILTARLGTLPQSGEDSDRDPAAGIDLNVDARIQQLWQDRDSDGLMRFYEAQSDDRLQLEAAEALAALGDRDALDVLIEALDDSDVSLSELAAQMLDWLNVPRGNRALRERGFQFETDAGNLVGGTQTPATLPAASPLISAKPLETRIPQAPPMPTARPVVVQSMAPPLSQAPALPGVLFAGAVGGLIGFMLFRFGMQVLNLLPLPANLSEWLAFSNLLYATVAVVAGTIFGLAGSRVAIRLTQRFGGEPAEGDPAPVIGALIEGLTSALMADFVLFFILTP